MALGRLLAVTEVLISSHVTLSKLFPSLSLGFLICKNGELPTSQKQMCRWSEIMWVKAPSPVVHGAVCPQQVNIPEADATLGYICAHFIDEHNLTVKKILISYSDIIELDIGDVSLLRKKNKTFLIGWGESFWWRDIVGVLTTANAYIVLTICQTLFQIHITCHYSSTQIWTSKEREGLETKMCEW